MGNLFQITLAIFSSQFKLKNVSCRFFVNTTCHQLLIDCVDMPVWCEHYNFLFWIYFIGNIYNVLDITLTNNFQYQTQFTDRDDMTWRDHRKKCSTYRYINIFNFYQISDLLILRDLLLKMSEGIISYVIEQTQFTNSLSRPYKSKLFDRVVICKKLWHKKSSIKSCCVFLNFLYVEIMFFTFLTW